MTAEDDKRPVRRAELGDGNPVVEAWLYADGSITIGNVQHGVMLVGGVHLSRAHAERLRVVLQHLWPVST